MPLDVTNAARQSRLFADMPARAWSVVTKQAVTYNSHHYGVLPTAYSPGSKLDSFYGESARHRSSVLNCVCALEILSTNVDRNGKRFVSAIEAKAYPIYGLQFHPEVRVGKKKKKKSVHLLHSRALQQCMYVHAHPPFFFLFS